MKIPRSILAILIIAFALTSAGSAQEINWLKSYDDAQKIARETGKPIMLDFTASWCKPCKLMDQLFWVRPDIVKVSEKFISIKVDMDSNFTLKRKYGVNAIPNVIFTDPWGRRLLSVTGFNDGTDEKFFDRLSVLPLDFHLIKNEGNLLKDNKEDLSAVMKVADYYHARNFYYLSIDLYKRALKLETDPLKRESTMIRVGFNYLRSDEPDEALDVFGKIRKEFPQSKDTDGVIYGQIYAYHLKNKAKDAQKLLTQLKTSFPDSKMIAEAEKTLAQPAPSKK